MLKLREECDLARQTLSQNEEALIEVKHLTLGNYNLKVKISRNKFEEICCDLFERCLTPLIMAMKEAGVTVNEI